MRAEPGRPAADLPGHDRPAPAAPGPPAGEEGEEAQVDPRYAAAQDALGEGDIDRAVEEYQKLVDANPADAEAAAGLAIAKVMQRTQGVDLQAARAAAAADPTTSRRRRCAPTSTWPAATSTTPSTGSWSWCAAPAATTAPAPATTCSGLFAAVGNDDERVLRGRRNLASALF